ncbi:hypothetical protein RRG08_032695 [Elysia crispata]|uniref:Secreted protein n=1 Tax=Elysia crispata TaxID=231223 RepID=A0AAE0YWG3_9GAST|nr:hypothetical protein RRG08_032695 [Elysia crispata]
MMWKNFGLITATLWFQSLAESRVVVGPSLIELALLLRSRKVSGSTLAVTESHWLYSCGNGKSLALLLRSRKVTGSTLEVTESHWLYS